MSRPTKEKCALCKKPIQIEDDILAVVESTGQLLRPSACPDYLVAQYPMHLECLGRPSSRQKARLRSGRVRKE